MEPPLLSVVIVAKNEWRHLANSIPVVLAQEAVGPYEVIVIDSGSSDGSVEFLEAAAIRDPRLRIHRIAPAEFHHARTRNLGTRLAKGRFIAFLGGDAIPLGQRWLATLSEPVRTGKAAASYGRQLPRPDANEGNACRMLYNYQPNSLLKRADTPLPPKELYFFSSVSCCIDRTLAPELLFDETYPVNEDTTLSATLIRNGHAIAYVAEAEVEHSHDYSYVEILQRYFDNAVVSTRLGVFRQEDAGRLRGEGLAYIRSSLRWLKGRGIGAHVRFATFFAVSALGVQLGLLHDRLPRAISRALSKYGTTE